MPMIHYGTHRSIATIILLKRGTLQGHEVVGRIGDRPLLARDVLDLAESGQLTVANSNSRGIPWFDDGKVQEIVDGFVLEQFFSPHRDQGIGILLDVGAKGSPFAETRGDYGYGAPVWEFVAAHV